MSDCKQYNGIDREELGKLRQNLAKEGITIPTGDDVNIEGPYGIELSAVYDEARATLKICITKKPFYIPEAAVWKIIDSGTSAYAE